MRPAKTFCLNVIDAEADSREPPSDVLPAAGDMAQVKDLSQNLTKTDQVIYLAEYHFYPGQADAETVITQNQIATAPRISAKSGAARATTNRPHG